MAARSTGLFPREGFNLDAEMQVPENSGGSVALLGDLSKAKTIRVIIVGAALTGAAEITFDMATTDSAYRTYTSADIDANGMIIDHVRGARLDGKTQDVAYQLVLNGGTASVDGVYLELVDGPRR